MKMKGAAASLPNSQEDEKTSAHLFYLRFIRRSEEERAQAEKETTDVAAAAVAESSPTAAAAATLLSCGIRNITELHVNPLSLG